MSLIFNKLSCVVLAVLLLPGLALAEEAAHKPLDLTASGVGIAAIIIFLVAYLLCICGSTFRSNQYPPANPAEVNLKPSE